MLSHSYDTLNLQQLPGNGLKIGSGYGEQGRLSPFPHPACDEEATERGVIIKWTVFHMRLNPFGHLNATNMF